MDVLAYNSNLSDAFVLAVSLSLIPLCSSLIVGCMTGVLQACTQVQESTISYVPKVCVVAAVLWFLGPWMGSQIVQFMRASLIEISKV